MLGFLALVLVLVLVLWLINSVFVLPSTVRTIINVVLVIAFIFYLFSGGLLKL